MIVRFQKYFLVAIAFLFLLVADAALAQFDVPPKPDRQQDQTAVYDYSNLLQASQKQALEAKLLGYADSTSTQIVVVIIDTSNDEDLSLLGARWGQQWGIGQAGEDNGILILLAKEDRKIDINTGYGIEYRMTDRMTERIINQVIIPQFKQNKYYEGLHLGTDAIIKVLAGEFEGTTQTNKKGISSQHILTIVFIFFILMLILRRRNKGGGKNNGGRSGSSLLDIIILSSMGRTGGFGGGGGGFGGGSGGFGGGGFGGGFGGGGFGGGGASGSW